MEIETVEEHCQHEDCVYRMTLDARGTPFCGYILFEQRSRGCNISACDKYKKGKRYVLSDIGSMLCEWRIL